MTDGLKFFIGVLLIVAIAGVSFVGINKANKAQKDKTSLISSTSDSIWSEIN